MKKLFSLILILVMIIGLVACGGGSGSTAKQPEAQAFESTKGSEDKEKADNSDKSAESAKMDEAEAEEPAEEAEEVNADFPAIGGYALAQKTVNYRNGAGTKYDKEGKVYAGEIIAIYDIQESDGYTWYQTSPYDTWVADDGTWFGPIDKFAEKIIQVEPYIFEVGGSLGKVAEDNKYYYWYWSGGGGWGGFSQSKNNPSEIFGCDTDVLSYIFLNENDYEIVKFNDMDIEQEICLGYVDSPDDTDWDCFAAKWHINDAKGEHVYWRICGMDYVDVTLDLDAYMEEYGLFIRE